MTKQVAAGLCIGCAALGYVAGMYWPWPTEDLGARLRRECDSIVRAAFGKEDYSYEFQMKECVLHRGRMGGK